MSKILHSFTLYERASAVLRKKSKKNQMSDNVSNAILWYYAQPKWEWIYKYDKDLDMDVQTDKKQLYRGYFDDEKKTNYSRSGKRRNSTISKKALTTNNRIIKLPN